MTTRKLNGFCKRMKLKNVTSDTQKKHGTVMLQDMILKNVFYTYHSNGYYRRRIRYGDYHGCKTYYDNYQLNKTRVDDSGLFPFRDRVLVPKLEDQLMLSSTNISHYRMLKLSKRNK